MQDAKFTTEKYARNENFKKAIEMAFGDSYNEFQIDALLDVLKFIKASTFSSALKVLLRKYSALPSVKNVEVVCREVQQELEQSQPTMVKSAHHSYGPQDFGVRADTFNAWFAALQIESRGAKIYVKVPKLIHQHWFADNCEGLMHNLLRPFRSNGITDVVFVFVSESGSRQETEVDVTEFTGVKKAPVQILNKNESIEVVV